MSEMRRRNPVLFPVAIVLVLFFYLAFMHELYNFLKTRADMSNYPEEVGIKIRSARWFANVKPDPALCLKSYKRAIELAVDEHGMHPMGDDVLGIWFELVGYLEREGMIEEAVHVLEDIRVRLLTYGDIHGDKEEFAKDRGRVMGKAIQCAAKISEFFTSPYFLNKQKSEEYLVWSVETSLKETARRKEQGIADDMEGVFLDADQQGANMEALAHHYETKSNFYFAAQLFLQSLTLKSTIDCHTVILMNNIATSIAQQTPYPETLVGSSHQSAPISADPSSSTVPTGELAPATTPAQLRQAARAWLQQSLQLSRTIRDPDRTEECDVGCIAATHNLGEFAEMDGKIAEARDKYEEAESLAHAMNYEEGLIQAREGLKRLDKGKRR
ncbi:MAG: hypothetical protein M1831_005638 [Alyxoria varia]|nr:MAG: hypothetical protein M1831_005638 [Alyxoria varia]